jgi:hypothetical protein
MTPIKRKLRFSGGGQHTFSDQSRISKETCVHIAETYYVNITYL